MQVTEWEGRVGRKWADEWRRTDRSFGGLTDQLLARVRQENFHNVLDIGCGAGELSLAIGRNHSGCTIVGVDVSQDLVTTARQRADHHANVEFELANAANWSREGFSPDLLVSRHGVMFFEEPVAAFSHFLGIAAPNARLLFSCFRDVAENPWASEIASLLPPELDSPPQSMVPGPFAFADQGAVRTMLEQAGWRDIHFEAVDFAYIAGAGDDAVEDALSYFLAIGPAAGGAAMMEDEARDAFVKRLQDYLTRNRSGNLVALRAAAWIVSARAA